MRPYPVILCFVLVFSSLAGLALPPVRAADWQQVTRFTGSGTQQLNTTEFSIAGSEWRIVWSYTPNSIEPSLTIFSFFIVRHGEGAPFGEYVYESGTDTTSGVLYIHEGPRPYYLMILAANTAGYTITVESDRSTEVGTGMLTLIIALVIAIPVALIIVMVYILRRRKRTQKAPTFAEYPQPPPPPPPA